MSGQTIDWSKYETQAAPAGSQIDWSKYEGQSSGKTTQNQTDNQSFLQRAATQPSGFSHLNPLRYLDELGQGMAQGAEMIAHPVDTAQKTYKFLTTNPNELQARDMENAKKPLLQMAGEGADTLAQSYGQAATMSAAGKTVAPILSKAAGALPDLRTVPEAVSDLANHPVAKFAGEFVDIASFGRIKKLWNAYNQMKEGLDARKAVYPGAPLPEGKLSQFPGAPLPEGDLTSYPGARLPEGDLTQYPGAHLPEGSLTKYPGAHLPDVPPPQMLQASALGQGPTSAAVSDQAAALGKGGAPTPKTTAPPADTEPFPSGEGLPRTMSGESVLQQVLAGRDNATLLKIARARGLNVAREAQLKAGVANKLIINKIVDDFSPDELQEVQDQNIENRRFRHAFGDLPEEAWNTLAMQTYFPDIKISDAALQRTQAAINKPATQPTSTEDLNNPDVLKQKLDESLKAFGKAKAKAQ